MVASPSYQVVYSGKLCAGFAQPQVKKALAEKLRVPPPQLEQIFSGKPVVLKRTNSAEEAKRLVAGLARLGAEATIKATKPSATVPTHTTLGAGITLPELPAAKGGAMLKSALTMAGSLWIPFSLVYLLLLLTFSLGLLYATLFTAWGTAITGFGPLALLLQLVAVPLGLVVLFFLAKPLLSMRPDSYQGMALSEAQAPKLHALVNAVCERLNTPPPQQLCIDSSTGATLAYAGGLGGLLKKQQVLTLGAPIVAACDVSQLAALIAQTVQQSHIKGIPPRALYLLRRGDEWLQRVVYGKDSIDRRLEEMVEEGNPLAPAIGIVQRAIDASRAGFKWYLRLSRRLGSRRLRHRLTYEGDRVGQALAGNEGLHHLIEQQRLLDHSAHATFSGIKDRWYQEGGLPENIVQALMQRARQYPPDTFKKLAAQQEQEKAAKLDPIPADSQRLKHLAESRVAAAYPVNAPAASLFQNFAKLSRTMTVHLYYNHLEIPASPERLAPPASPDEEKQRQTIEAIFQKMYVDLLPLKLGHRMKMIRGYEAAVAARDKALQEIKTGHANIQLAHQRYVGIEEALYEISAHDMVYRADLWKRWGLPKEDKQGLNQIHLACRDQEKELEENLGLLAHQLQPQVTRLAAGLTLLGTPQAGRVKNAAALAQEVSGLITVLDSIEHAAPQLRDLRLHTALLRILLSFDGSTKGKRGERIQEQTVDVRQLLAGVGGGFKTTPYPFGSSYKNLMAYAQHQSSRDDTPEGELDRGLDMVTQITALHRRIMARLCAIALYVEKGLGL